MDKEMTQLITINKATTICIYDKSEKEFIRTNPICRDCLVQAMCIEETYSRIGIRVRVCKRLYKYWLKMNYKNFNKGETRRLK